MSTNLIKGFIGAQRRPIRLLAILSLVVVIAASCSSDTATAATDDTGADKQSSATTAAPEAEITTTTTTTEPEPEPVVEEETLPAPDATIIAFVEAFGIGDADEAWSFNSVRCQGRFSDETMEMPQGYRDDVAAYARTIPGATAENVRMVDVDVDRAGISYDVHDDSGELAQSYLAQKWIFSDGQWLRDAC